MLKYVFLVLMLISAIFTVVNLRRLSNSGDLEYRRKAVRGTFIGSGAFVICILGLVISAII